MLKIFYVKKCCVEISCPLSHGAGEKGNHEAWRFEMWDMECRRDGMLLAWLNKRIGYDEENPVGLIVL